MVLYTCEKCGKPFNRKSNYEQHLNKKNPCIYQNKLEEIIEKVIEKKNNNKLENKIKFIDLFSGIGSFHYSFKKLGWECVMASDIDKAARDTYKENHSLEPLGDILKIDPKTIPNYDILCAGIPCQPFSQCGKHLGFNDERGTMFYQVMKFVKHHKPKIVIIENVKGLLNHDNGSSFNKIKEELNKENYKVEHKILMCSDYGLPQMRQRLFIIGILGNEDIKKIFELDEYKKETTLKDFFGKNFEKEIAYTIRCGGRKSPIDDKHNWDGYWIDKKEYRLTILDCLKLQGFPNDFKLIGNESEKWKMVGNTIPTIFTDIIGKNLQKYIFDKPKTELVPKLKTKNKGEAGEEYVIKKLFNLNKNKEFDVLISLLGTDASEGITLYEFSDDKEIIDENQIKKAPSNCKSDCKLKLNKTGDFLNISIKCKHGSPPAIINHTNRKANVFQNGCLNNELVNLDEIIIKLNKLRKEGSLKEDININSQKLTKKQKDSLIKVISYFVFDGTGSVKSLYPVDSILEIDNPEKIDTWKLIICKNEKNKIDYIESIYNSLVLSIRDKGMPKKESICDIIKPWVYEPYANKIKGSLHIRIGKIKAIEKEKKLKNKQLDV